MAILQETPKFKKCEAWDSMKAHMDDHETVIQGIKFVQTILSFKIAKLFAYLLEKKNIDEDELNAQ